MARERDQAGAVEVRQLRRHRERLEMMFGVMAGVAHGLRPREELLPWLKFGEDLVKALHRPGAPSKGPTAVRFVQEQLAQGGQLNNKLIGQAADRAGCSVGTVRDHLSKAGIIKKP